jgi:DNA-binding MarR family transcriptional regulator
MKINDFSEGLESIDSAYEELSPQCFALWVRLMTVSDEDLSGDRKKLAKKLGYTAAGLSRIIRELKRKDYIKINPGLRTKITGFTLTRRLILKGKDRITVLN